MQFVYLNDYYNKTLTNKKIILNIEVNKKPLLLINNIVFFHLKQTTTQSNKFNFFKYCVFYTHLPLQFYLKNLYFFKKLK